MGHKMHETSMLLGDCVAHIRAARSFPEAVEAAEMVLNKVKPRIEALEERNKELKDDLFEAIARRHHCLGCEKKMKKRPKSAFIKRLEAAD